MPFKSAFGCFKGVVVYLSCMWLFSVLFGFFQGLIWPFLLDYLATLVLALVAFLVELSARGLPVTMVSLSV